MEIQCTFDKFNFNGTYYYRCLITDQYIPEYTRLRFIGLHNNGFNNRNVNYIHFKNCTMLQVPQLLTKVFRNLKVLDIESSGLNEISKEYLEEYNQLENLHFRCNSIEFLPADLFEGFVNLKRIDFWKNELSNIEPNILDCIPNIEFVNFGEPEYFCQFSTCGRNRSIGTLEDFKRKLIEDYGNKSESSDEDDENEGEDDENEEEGDDESSDQDEESDQEDNDEENKRAEAERLMQQIVTIYQNVERQLMLANSELYQKNRELNLKNNEIQEKNEELRKYQEKLASADLKIDKLENENQKLKAQLEAEKYKTSKYADKLEKGILSDVIDLIQNEDAKDFNIIINEHEFPVHKFILQARSPTLAEILQNNPEIQSLNLTDIDEEVFEKILQFFYTDNLPHEDQTVTTDYLKLFAAAGILQIQDLKYFAGVKLCNYITKENVLNVLALSAKYDHDVLKSCAFDEIKKFYSKIKFDNSWINDVSKILHEIKKKTASRIPVRISMSGSLRRSC